MATDRGPAIHVPPPLLFAAGFALGWALDRMVALRIPPEAMPAFRVMGALVGTAGAAFSLSGLLLLLRARTAILPFRPATAFVTWGPYRVTRNPIYLGLATMYLGAAAWAGLIWPVLTLPPTLITIRHMVIGPEERHLEERFGDEYRAYRRRVRRWV